MMTEEIGKLFQNFTGLTDQQLLETWNKGAYYTALTNKPKLRILGYNTLYGSIKFIITLNLHVGGGGIK